MDGRTGRIAASLGLLMVCGLIAAGCGDDEDSSSAGSESTAESTDASAEERIDAAVESCTTRAGELREAPGAALEAACTTVGDNVKQALASGGEQVEEALSQVADSCDDAVAQLPEGDAQAALSDLCAAIEA